MKILYNCKCGGSIKIDSKKDYTGACDKCGAVYGMIKDWKIKPVQT